MYVFLSVISINVSITLSRVSKLPSTTIHDLDEDSLLHIFYLLRPSLLKRDESGFIFWEWDSQRWWYKLAQVCLRWRHLILGSASYLGLRLVCGLGTPVADMLAHSPPFSLIIYHNCLNRTLTTEDEEGILLALQHRDRVQGIYLHLPVPTLERLIIAIDNEFPALEYIDIGPPTKHDSHLTLPLTFEAPPLRRLWTNHLASPIGSTLLSTAIDLVELSLGWIHPSAYPHPNDFLQQLSLLPQLERLVIRFRSPVPSRDIEGQLLHTPVTMHFTLPSLRIFYFQGVSAFLEAILPHMDAPLLETFSAEFFNQLRFSIPHVPHFIMTKEKLRFGHATFIFHKEAVFLLGFTGVAGQWSNINVAVMCRHLDWQVSSMAQISNVLYPLFSEVVDLTLDYRDHTLSSEWHNQADCTLWRVLLGSFRHVKTLRVHNGLVGEVSRALQMDVEPPLEVLPELKELVCPAGRVDDKTFALLIREREVAGRPVSLIGKTFPVGRTHYIFYSSTGNIDIGPDQDPPS